MENYMIAYHVKSMHPHFALLSKYDSHNISISFYASQWYLNFEALEKLHIVLGETKFPNKTDMDIVNIITDYGMHKWRSCQDQTILAICSNSSLDTAIQLQKSKSPTWNPDSSSITLYIGWQMRQCILHALVISFMYKAKVQFLQCVQFETA